MRTPRPPAPASLLALALMVGVGAGLTFASCSGKKPDLCWGGVVLADGGCVAKCDPAKCLANNTCVNNDCALKCTGYAGCNPTAQRCQAATEDDTDAGVMVCLAYDAGTVGLPCPRATECTAPERCLTAGPGDATAYCTGDCTADTDCPSGFECAVTRDPHKVCLPDGGAHLGSSMCGTTTEPCLDPATVAASPVLTAGPYCLERKTCLKRGSCSPCNQDLDCSFSSERCISFGAGKVCAPDCSVNTDCEADKHCVSGSCLPWYGACAAPAGGGFCAPCRTDLDCGGNYSCEQLHGFEKSCIDLRFSATCTVDTDCPVAPSGRHGMCLDARAGLDATSSVYLHCYAPFTESTNVFSCYYAPTAQMPWPDAG